MQPAKLLIYIGMIVLCLPIVNAANFQEDFENYNTIGFDPELKPDQEWYNYEDVSDIGNISNQAVVIRGFNSMHIRSNVTDDISNKVVKFDLEVPTQLDSIEFTMEGATLTDNGLGSQQFVTIQSSFPVRRIVEFYLFCRNNTGNASFNDACQLRVRWLEADTDGQVLVDYNATDQRFKINATLDWIDAEFCLTVDGVNDGCFPFFELPENIGRLSINQYRTDIAMNVTFDDWNITNAVEGSASPVESDAANGLKDFATDMHFTSATSLFIFGLILFIIIMAGLLTAMFTHGKTNGIASASAYFAIILIFWLIQMEFWPDWVGITAIIIVSSMVGLILRKVMIGITNANNGPSLVLGGLGFFIICATFLAMAGYSTTSIEIPIAAPTEAGAASQSFGEAVLECTITLFTDCSQDTQSQLWATITDIFGWIIAATTYLFQLMTFQLPIPTILNIIIVLPPAATLAAYAVQLIRGLP